MGELYGQEINWAVSSFWDGGWTVKLGDDLNGFVAENTFHPKDLGKAAKWLAEQAEKHFPPRKVIQFPPKTERP
jgi:hypothetical protein